MTNKVNIILAPSASGNEVFIPSLATEGSSGYDLRAAIVGSTLLHAGQTLLIPTGFKIDLMESGLSAVLLPRSGLGHKEGIVLGNGSGLIDKDYQGEVFVSLLNRNHEGRPFKINRGDRIAQMVLQTFITPEIGMAEGFGESTERGEDGFNSTGVE